MIVPNVPILVFQREALQQSQRSVWISALLKKQCPRVWSSNSHEDIVLDFHMYRTHARGIFPYQLIVLYAGAWRSRDHEFSMYILRQLCVCTDAMQGDPAFFRSCEAPFLLITQDVDRMRASISGWGVDASISSVSESDTPLIRNKDKPRVYVYPNPIQEAHLVQTVQRILLNR